MKKLALSILASCMLTGNAAAQSVTSVPASLNIPNYYTKYCSANGVHIVASDKAPDSCLVRTAKQIEALTASIHPDVLKAMQERGARIDVMGRYEGISQLPEFKNMEGMRPSWDIHYRGIGATDALPVTLGAEENILAYQIDPNYAEDILVKYFAQSIFSLGIKHVDAKAEKTLQKLYKKAIKAGKWKDTYAAQSMMDYWSEGVQDWFGINAESPLPNGEHNWVNTREELKRYDAGLYAFISKYIAADTQYVSCHPAENLYTKDDKEAWDKLHEEVALNIDVPQCKVEQVSEELAKMLKLDTSFYKKYVNCNGIHILSSDEVPDDCLAQAHKTVYCMTSMLPKEVLDAMARVNTRVVVMGKNEVTIQVPEHSNLARDRRLNWNLRARGLGGTLDEPITSCAEENIMAHPWDKYHAEDILIHEFSHSIELIGILQVDPTIETQLKDLLAQARAEGKWENTYAGSNPEEYWAEGVQNWFNVNAETPVADSKHNQINTREELKAYDPRLYKLISKYFPETNAQIGKHKKVNLYEVK